MNNFIIVHLKYVFLTSSDLNSKNYKYLLKTDWIMLDYFSSERDASVMLANRLIYLMAEWLRLNSSDQSRTT